jgi:hypothetical protein
LAKVLAADRGVSDLQALLVRPAAPGDWTVVADLRDAGVVGAFEVGRCGEGREFVVCAPRLGPVLLQ